MKDQSMYLGTGLALGVMISMATTGFALAQQVYRCEQSSGSITFSDLPCRSDVGHEQRIDATPHQGHRANSAQYESGVTGHQTRPASGSAHAAQTRSAPGRNERLTLERRRVELLSGLKRRHVKSDRRRAMIAELRGVDRQLGIGPADVADMPFHNREVYEDNQVFRPADR